MRVLALAALSALVSTGCAQTFQRLGACPTLGCVFPPDQAEFLAGQYFDIRLEVHAPVNGSEANGLLPDPDFTFEITQPGKSPESWTSYFNVSEPELENWSFSWYEDLFARDAGTASLVNVTSKVIRRVYLTTPGVYNATLTYNDGTQTVAEWTVRDIEEVRRTKNIIFFIGDGMTTNMITAARLIGHKMINGKYQTLMAMDEFPVLGHQMTHSLDTYITDSANSATALYTGHKTNVNALGVYGDSSKSPFDDPKIETIAELFHRLTGGGVGIVSTAYIADATPAALTAHTRDRGQYGAVIDSFLNGITNYTWTNWTGPDVLFGGGAENFDPEIGSTYMGQNYYDLFQERGYELAMNATELDALPNDQKALGIFCISNMAKWLDRNVYTENLHGHEDAPDGSGADAVDQPGLKEMTLKAIDILQARNSEKGWFIMSEAASIDKQMHTLDYDRALGELLELDDTIRHTKQHLSDMGILDETLILVTADHGHGFDVAGSVDTKYLQAQETDRKKRGAVGTYQMSGQSMYQNSGNLTYTDGTYFPHNWDPRYTLFQGMMATPDHHENYMVHKDGPREPAVNITPKADFYANPEDSRGGFFVNGTLPVNNDQGVHSLTDVPVFAMGPCQELFSGVFSAVDIFFGLATCFGLSQTGQTGGGSGGGDGGGWGSGGGHGGGWGSGGHGGPPGTHGKRGYWQWVDEE
ncbi:alkaline phosphatase [Aulographum hederae CBS 113979]|uniref:alkaline phosphatase n=1 Tax=Aulographum hederae CBS 113979 TaxID=1176131 RepID=A0A6G1HFF0_9PEZI|nr:alkaline phosphatase [Aulographum hederae CBS 113979]